MNANNKKAKENASKNKKMRLIRLDDLIPKKECHGRSSIALRSH